jgi:hypothetical protein
MPGIDRTLTLAKSGKFTRSELMRATVNCKLDRCRPWLGSAWFSVLALRLGRAGR